MNDKLDTKRITIYLAIAFSIAWMTALFLYLNGGLINSPMIQGTQIPLAIPVLAIFYMGAPTVANVLTRLITREGWHNAYLKPKLKHGWPAWLAAWFGPGLMTIFGAAVFFLIFPQYFDPYLGKVAEMMKLAAGDSLETASVLNPWLIVLGQTITALLISPLLNSLATFGEEFGWRAYLLQKLLPLGWRKATLLMGVIWGVWHWPVIAMGHNYGLDYPGYPWAGMLMMVAFTFFGGAFLGWAALRGGSVWPAVIGHAAMNGIAGLAFFMVKGQPSSLLGPVPVGIVGMAGYILVGLWVFLRYQPAQDEETNLMSQPHQELKNPD